MVERPEWVHFLGRKFTDFYREDYTRAAEATGGRIDLYLLISDLGSQSGPLISRPMFREFVAPYIQEMADCIHGLGGKVLYHSCGSIGPLIPDLIQLGVDILDPIQPIGPRWRRSGSRPVLVIGSVSTAGSTCSGSCRMVRPRRFAPRSAVIARHSAVAADIFRARPPLPARRAAGEHPGRLPGVKR